MNIVSKITARLQAHTALTADVGLDNVYKYLHTKLGKESRKRANRGSQEVTWVLGSGNRGQRMELIVGLDLKDAVTTVIYNGLAGEVSVFDEDATTALRKFKAKAKRWLSTGNATPEDREALERFI